MDERAKVPVFPASGAVLYAAGRVAPGSLSALGLDTVRALRARGRGVHLLCKGLPAGEGGSVPGIRWRGSFDVPPWSSARWARRLVARTGAALVHALDLDVGSAGARFLRRCPVPLIVNVAAPVRPTGCLRSLRRRVARVVAICEETRQAVVERVGVPEEKVVVLAPGIDFDALPPPPPPPADRVPVIGAAGPLRRDAGLGVFLQAAELLLRQTRRVRFLVAGDGPEERALRARARSLGIAEFVCFAPRLSEFRTVLGAMDIFVSPSAGGAFPAALLDAMAAGKAVVAVGMGGAGSFLRDGVSGRLVAGGDPKALCDALADLVRDGEQARRMGLEARRALRARCDLSEAVERLLQLYADVLDASRGSGKERMA